MTVPIGEQFDLLVQFLEGREWTSREAKIEVVKYLQRFSGHATHEQKTKLLITAANRLGVGLDQLRDSIEGQTAPEGLFDDFIEPEVSDVLPTGGWLGEYLRLTGGHEAPDIFHFWVGVAVLSACLKRSVKFDKSYYRVYPNHYIILVSPSGVCRKTTACGIGVDLLRYSETANIISEKVTPEALIEALSIQVKSGKGKGGKETKVEGDPTAMIFAPELGVFLGRQQYNEDMIDLLTSLADARDAPFDYITRSRGKFRLRGATLALLGCTTPEWMSIMFPQLAYGGGLMARTMFIHRSSTPRRFAFPKIPSTAKPSSWFVAAITDISRMEGIYTLDREGEEWYDNWYTTYPKHQEHLALSHYYERKPDHLIRLAMILGVSESKPMVITRELFERALAIIDVTEVSMPEAFQRVDTTPLGKDHDRVVYTIQKAGGTMSRSELLRRLYRSGISGRRLSELIDTLAEARIVTVTLTAAAKGRGETIVSLRRKE